MYLLMVIIGFSAGIVTAMGIFALVTALRIVNRYAQITRTAVDIIWYEECVIFGAGLGNLIYIFNIYLPFGALGLVVYGIAGGIYVGCLSVALCETIKTFPVMVKRIKINAVLGELMLLFAWAKGIGNLIYFMILN